MIAIALDDNSSSNYIAIHIQTGVEIKSKFKLRLKRPRDRISFSESSQILI